MLDFSEHVVYEHIKNNIGEDGRLPSMFDLNIINGIGTKQGAKVVPGFLDGVLVKHSVNMGNPGNPVEAATEAADLLLTYFLAGGDDLLDDVEKILDKNSSLSIAEYLPNAFRNEMKEYMQSSAHGSIDRYSLLEDCLDACLNLIKTSKNIDLIKIAIAILDPLGPVDIDKTIEVLTILATSDEFTLYAVVAIEKWSKFIDTDALIFDIAKKVDGWGRVHAVNHLDLEIKEIREWLVRECCNTTYMAEYIALLCAYAGDIISILRSQEPIDSELAKGISIIMETLLADDVPGYGISAYKHAEEALLLCNKRSIRIP
jgi:hypothetical protein